MLVVMTYKSETREIQENHPRIKQKGINFPSAVRTWIRSMVKLLYFSLELETTYHL